MKPGVIIAAVLAVGVAAVVFMSMNKPPAPAPSQAQAVAAPQLKTVNVYVASQAIPVGTKITPEMLTVQPWPENLVLESFVKSDAGAKDAVGYVARGSFQQNEPLIKSKLANPSDPNFLAGELPKGMRVVTVMTTETDGVAGFVFPGDRVDVILTHDVQDVRSDMLDPSRPQLVNNSIAETLLTNVKVVAVDQRASGAKTTDEQGKPIIPRSVSLMVSPTDAQRLRLGQKVGTLTLALRSLEDRDSADPLIVTGVGDISQHKQSQSLDVGGVSSDVKIYRGATMTKSSSDAAPTPATPAAGASAPVPGAVTNQPIM